MSAESFHDPSSDAYADLDAGRDIGIDAEQHAVQGDGRGARQVQPVAPASYDSDASRLEPAASGSQSRRTPSLRLPDSTNSAQELGTQYLPATTGSLLPPADFKPFFALIEDLRTGEHHHPTVHYLFSDDEDQDVLTSAAINLVEDDEASEDQGAALDHEERVVLIDLEVDGKTVIAASSMSPNWQAVKAELTQAPSWGHGATGSQKGTMLKLTGQESRANVGKDGQMQEGLDELINTFERQLESLSEVLGKEEEPGEAQE